MVWSWIWKLGFWGIIVMLVTVLGLELFDIPYDNKLKGFSKFFAFFTFFSMWSYAFYKAFKAKGVFKKIWLFIVAIVFNVTAGLFMFFYDNYSANSDIKNN